MGTEHGHVHVRLGGVVWRVHVFLPGGSWRSDGGHVGMWGAGEGWAVRKSVRPTCDKQEKKKALKAATPHSTSCPLLLLVALRDELKL